ncbi:MAG TPA: hypothetical protein VMX54_15650 [Vicinamibacteria bacterium]|nr:hypothetical protein [Vicinamibacteria bacterium]
MRTLRRLVARLRLYRAERAVDRPFNARASSRIDALVLQLEALR